MSGRSIVLFRVLGFDIKADFSWVFLAILVTWSLAEAGFPHYVEGLSERTYWVMGIVGALGLFTCLIIHEMCHSLVARHYGVPIRGITLFIFGGVAEMEGEPQSPEVEFLMAAAGPAGSFGLALLFYLLMVLGSGIEQLTAFTAVVGYLALINFLLAVFNLVPGFPLDGGRILRSIIWYRTGNLKRATEYAASAGSGFGFMLIALGVLTLVSGDFIGGIWWCLLGLFLRSAAISSVSSMTMRQLFEGEPVSKFMTADPITVPPETSIREFIDNYVYRYYHEMFPVVDQDRLVGCINLPAVKAVPSEDWIRARVGDLTAPVDASNTIDANDDVLKVMDSAHRTGNGRFMVLRNGRLVGVVVLKDVMKMLAMRLEFTR